jgi:peptidoglycan hydrolase-like protein with peptidoglycan-binding domain
VPSVTAIDPERRQAAPQPELEPHAAAPAAAQPDLESSYVGTYSDRLRNDGLNNINIVPFGAMLNDPDGNADQYRPYRNYGSIS